MHAIAWYVAVGVVLILLAMASSWVRRIPFSMSILCLILGIALGPAGFKLFEVNFIHDAVLLERLSEVAVIMSLFTAGLQLRLPLNRPEWRVSLVLAAVTMTLTVALIAGIGVFALGLPLGAAVILGALLAPTDPVLASDVQVKKSTDDDRLRFMLTAEAGLNDGTAFPFIMLGLGLLGMHEIGAGGWRWWAVDVLWAVSAGLAIGALLGTGVGKLVLYLRRQHREAVGLDNFLAVGLIALSYGVALYAHSYGFLAVFAAGLALRRVERNSAASPPSDEIRASAGSSESSELATSHETAPAYMAEAVLNFNAHMEHFAEVVMVILLGTMLSLELLSTRLLMLAAAMVFVVRPLAVYLSLFRLGLSSLEHRYIAWFGIRGIGSIYYLSYAIVHGLPTPSGHDLVNVALLTITMSIFLHGVSVTPMMSYYSRAVRGNATD